MRINHVFTQHYHNWGDGVNFDDFTARSNTFDILEKLDSLESEVYRDRDFNLANDMLKSIGV